MFVNFKNVLDSIHPKLPFGLAQIGKNFRNEITPATSSSACASSKLWSLNTSSSPRPGKPPSRALHQRINRWFERIGLETGRHPRARRPRGRPRPLLQAHVDFEYKFPIGTKELGGFAYRTDFDLKPHGALRRRPHLPGPNRQAFIPHVLEPTFGLDRHVLAVMAAAYHEEQVGEGDTRVVLKFKPELAPVKIAVSPLLRNKPELVAKARRSTAPSKKTLAASCTTTTATSASATAAKTKSARRYASWSTSIPSRTRPSPSATATPWSKPGSKSPTSPKHHQATREPSNPWHSYWTQDCSNWRRHRHVYRADRAQKLRQDITAVVNMVDDGGSTGVCATSSAPAARRRPPVAGGPVIGVRRAARPLQLPLPQGRASAATRLATCLSRPSSKSPAPCGRRPGGRRSSEHPRPRRTRHDRQRPPHARNRRRPHHPRRRQDRRRPGRRRLFVKGEPHRLWLEPSAKLNPDAKKPSRPPTSSSSPPASCIRRSCRPLLVEGMGEALRLQSQESLHLQSHDPPQPNRRLQRPGLCRRDRALCRRAHPRLRHLQYRAPTKSLLDRYALEGEREPVEYDPQELKQQHYQAIGAPLISKARRSSATPTTPCSSVRSSATTPTSVARLIMRIYFS
jgi:hypothetical protein